MAHRTVLTGRQREALFALPRDHAAFLRHYVLSDADLDHVARRRSEANRVGFAMQLCAMRYPGRLIAPGEAIPEELLAFVAGQLGTESDGLAGYADRWQTRYEHASAIQSLYGYRSFEGQARQEAEDWLAEAAATAPSNHGLVAAFVAALRQRQVIVPGAPTVERLCADALVRAEREACRLIASRLPEHAKRRLATLLTELTEDGTSLFVWLRRRDPRKNSADANALMDRLERIEGLDVPSAVLDGVAPHRRTQLRGQGERYFADGLKDVPEDRRYAIMAACVVAWRAALIDALVLTHDRIVGKLYRDCERACAEEVAKERASVADTLRSLSRLGAALVAAHEDGVELDQAVEDAVGWDALPRLVKAAEQLTATVSADPLDGVAGGYARFRRYAPRMLAMLSLEGGPAAAPLLRAIGTLRDLDRHGDRNLPKGDLPIAFARPVWRRRLVPSVEPDRRTWETAVLFALRDALRSGDVWIEGARQHGEPSTDLVPIEAAMTPAARLAVPLNGVAWIEAKRAELDAAMRAVARLSRGGRLPGGWIEDGQLRPDRLDRDVPVEAGDLTLQLYRSVPEARITDLLLEADRETGFADAFTDLRNGAPCKDKIGLLSVLLADGVNLGLRKMAAASGTHSRWELMRIARWYVTEDAYERALAALGDAQAALPMSRVWGEGLTSSSDGQFFPAGGTGEAVGLVNAKYGSEPGVKGYAHVSDLYAPYWVRTIPATASEAPYILDGLLSNEAGQRVREHYADTGGFTDHVFAVCSVLGYAFAPRIRDLPTKRLYAFEPKAAPRTLQPLIAQRVRADLIERNWPDILRLAASMSLGAVVPSQVLRKLASYPRQNDLALALREVGRVERSLFMLRWIADPDLQRRAQTGLNKGEAHHALKRAIAFHRRGEIRDRTTDGQGYRLAALNLLTMLVIWWNTKKLGDAAMQLAEAGSPPDPGLLRHVSPLGWEHINLTGEYRWPDLAAAA